jgi:ATP-dependent exoDNAse (exonuclease V) beta subunit
VARRRLLVPLDLPLRMRAFTPEQRVAIERREGAMLLSANAGSGKTAVLTERFVRAVREDGLAPGALLAITFTEKAAGELRSRVRERFAELGDRASARDTEGAWISTIHGFCARVLRAHAVAAGLDPAFTVLDQSAARALRGSAFEEALAALMAGEDGRARLDALDLAATWGVDRLQSAVASVHDELRSRGETVPGLPPCRPRRTVGEALDALGGARDALAAEAEGWRTGPKSLDAAREALGSCAEQLGTGDAEALAALRLRRSVDELKTPAADAFARGCTEVGEALADAEACGVHALLDELLARYAAAYAAAKRGRSGVDYDDLELHVRDLFERAPAIADHYAERFARIMVDEFQDTNPLQLALLRPLDRGNIFLVGDELQSIYGFRHADVRVFRRLRAEHEAEGAAPSLATNWRSRPELLGTINAAFGTGHRHYVPLEAGREEPPDAAPRVELLLTDAAYDDLEQEPGGLAGEVLDGMPPGTGVARAAEARAVARRVRALVDAGECRPSEVALLLRAATDLNVFERALELEGLPTLASGGRGYWLRQPVQDLTSYLGALANPYDEAALLGLLASPLVGLSADGLAHLALETRGDVRVWDVVASGRAAAHLGATDRALLGAFVERFSVERERAPRHGLDVLIARAVEHSGYDLHVLRLPGGRRRLANVQKLERLAAEYEALRGRDVRGFIDHANAEVEAEAREPEAPIELGDLEAVQLMTIHAAKGLQFGVVVVADLGRQGRASLPDLLVDDAGRVGLRLVRLGAENVNALDYDALKEAAHQAQAEEERRILHVAMTRAEERLILSGTAKLGEEWPAPSVTAAPLSWMGAALGTDLPFALSADAPVLDVDRATPAGRLRFRAALNAPGTAGPALGLQSAPQLELPGLRDADPDAAPRRAAPVAPPLAVVPAAPAPGARVRVATVSFTTLARYAQCPYRFYLERVLRLPQQEPPPGAVPEPAAAAPAGTGLDPLTRGSVAHRLLEDDLPPTEGAIAAVAAEFGAEVTEADVADLRALVEAWEAGPLAGRLRAAARVHRERGFAFPLDPDDHDAPLLNGVIDVLAEEGGGAALVVDYKTNPVAGADLEALVERSYGTQRRVYALAALQAGAREVEVAYAFLERASEPVVARYAPADAPRLRAELRAAAAGLLAGAFPVTEAPHRELCATCPGRGGLCSWPAERVLQPLEPAPEG